MGLRARRLLALAAIYDGAGSQDRRAAKIGGVTLQIVRDWVMKFNAHGPGGLIDCKPPGQPSRSELARTALRSPRYSRAARSRPCMASCAGGSSTSANGSSRNSGGRRRQADIEPGIARTWDIVSSRLVPVITSRLRAQIEDFKKLSRAPGRDRAREGRRSPPP